MTRYFISLEHSPISRKTEQELTVFRSSDEVEYSSMAVTCCELKLLRYLLPNLKVPQLSPTPLFLDNTIQPLCTSLQIRFSMNILSTLKSTVTLSRMIFKPIVFLCPTSSMFNRLTYLPKL